MKLIHKVTIRLAITILPLLLLWSTIFYFSMVEEINDETDDSIDDYAEMIAMRISTGEELPRPGNGSNNTYSIEVLPQRLYPSRTKEFVDREVFIPEKGETEPARTLTMFFTDDYGTNYKITVSTPTFERDDIIRAILIHIITLYAVLVGTIMLVTTMVFNYSMKPLYSLLKWLKKYSPGKGTKDFPDEESVMEFRRLTQAARITIERAEKQLELQKQFTGNASHELQTPLAILGTRIEWLIDKTTLTDEQFAELSKMRQSLHRLAKLNRTLLLLSKIDSGQFIARSEVDLAGIIENEAGIYKEIFDYKEIDCTIRLPKRFTASMDESLATTMISNLIKNAYLHSPENGKIEIETTEYELRISNSGETGLDATRIFDRFYTNGKSGSTGLGLALVKSIADSYNFAFTYNFTGKMHCFTVRF